jgi:hypothetical protein
MFARKHDQFRSQALHGNIKDLSDRPDLRLVFDPRSICAAADGS